MANLCPQYQRIRIVLVLVTIIIGFLADVSLAFAFTGSPRAGAKDGQTATSCTSYLFSVNHSNKRKEELYQLSMASWGVFENFKPKQAEEPPTRVKKKPVLICPAQFCVAEDYADMIEILENMGHKAYVADIGRSDWLKIVPATFTIDYWTGNLKPKNCLQFFFEGIEKTMERVKKENPGEQVNIIGHSIGGWIVRSYLGEVCTSAEREAFCSLTLLGSPQQTPPEGTVWAAADQTRGLLRHVNENFPGAFHPGLRYTAVAGAGQEGALLAGGLQAAVAYSSYLPLCGDGNCRGDGIVPVETALLDGAEALVLEGVKHAGWVPTPGTSLKLPESYLWYGSPGVVERWAGSSLE